MSDRRAKGGSSSVVVGAVLLLGMCGITAVFIYFYSQSQSNVPTALPTSAVVAQIPTAAPGTSTSALQPTNTPIPTQPMGGGVATVDNSVLLTQTAVAQEEKDEAAQVFLTQTRPFIPTSTPRPPNTAVPPAASATSAVTVAPSRTPVPTQAPNTGWGAEYFDNQNLTAPVRFYAQDPLIAFDWGTGSPGNGIPDDHFSVRWQKVQALSPGMHRFFVRADDGVRVWLNDQLIIDRWDNATDQTYSADREITAVNNNLRVEYFENVGDAQIQFWWEKIGDFTDWRGQYYNKRSFDDSALALMRNDKEINFQWGEGAPANGLPIDNFYVRWSRTLSFNPDRYRFFATVDDGVRIYVDGKLVLDDWNEQGMHTVSAATNISQGEHIIVVEYFENIGDAQVKVWWEKDVATATPTPTPTVAAYP